MTTNGAHSAHAQKAGRLDFGEVAAAALSQSHTLLERWLPGGRWEGLEYVVRNPTRPDASPGSFKINGETGTWCDFATGDKGGDLIDLKALISNAPLIDAAKAIAAELGVERKAARSMTLEAYAAAKRLPADFLASLGLETIRSPYTGLPAVAIPYRDADGEPVRTRLRIALSGKPKTVWDRQKEKGVTLYGLDRLPDSASMVLIVEGESDAQTLWHRGHGALGVPGVENFKPDRDDAVLNGLEIVALIEPGEGGEAMMRRLRLSKHAARIKTARLDCFKDVSELHIKAPDRFDAVLAKALAEAKPLVEPGKSKPEPKKARSNDAASGEDERKPTQADILVRLATDAATLFTGPDETAFAMVEAEGHRETWPLRSRGFKSWAVYRYFRETGRAPNADAINQALCTLGAIAQFDGEAAPVFTRTAEHAGRLYVDLCDDAWRAIEIDATGWRIVEQPPVRFVRTKGMLALPDPVRGGKIDDLRPLLNVASEDDFRLIVGWLLAALRPAGPFPLLAICGEAGSAKSTAAKVLRSLVDPNVAPLRSTPKDERDLFIGAANSACLVFDNLSSIPAWLSDALCRVATGGSYATRTLHTDADETMFDVSRPVLLTSVGEVIARSDLADRAVLVTLASIGEARRMADDEFNVRLEAARPRVLGALLDAVAVGLRELPGVELDRMPRMANFIRWTRACEAGLWEPGSIQDAFDRNVADAVDSVLESDPVAVALLTFLEHNAGRWRGSCKDLLQQLGIWAPEGALRDRSWPRTPQALTGRVTLAAPSLRKKGIAIERSRAHGVRSVSITTSA
ncbi:MAG: hypothetical protein WAN43_01215 [Rhodomicrobium sp.]